MDGWMDGWIVGWMNGWKDGGMAGLKNKHKENRVFFTGFSETPVTLFGLFSSSINTVVFEHVSLKFYSCFDCQLRISSFDIRRLVNPPKLGVALKLSPKGRGVKNWLGDHSRISFIIIHSTDRLVAQLIKIYAKTRYKDTCPQVIAFANLGGTVMLKH